MTDKASSGWSLARQLFQREMHQPDTAIDLERASLYIAQEDYPTLDVEEYLNALDTMAAEVTERLPTTPYPLKILQTISHYLYDDLGFVGNTTDYYDPRNSFLNEVIDRRTGIPITLSLVYLAIARRIDFPMVGVGMPGHFLIRPDVEAMEILVDPFHSGEILFPQDCEERLTQLYGRPVTLDPSLLQAIGPRQYLTRMLTNLKVIYVNRGDLAKALAAVERILLVMPDLSLEVRDRGVLCYHLDRLSEAQRYLKDYLAGSPTAPDAPAIRALLQSIVDGQSLD